MCAEPTQRTAFFPGRMNDLARMNDRGSQVRIVGGNSQAGKGRLKALPPPASNTGERHGPAHVRWTSPFLRTDLRGTWCRIGTRWHFNGSGNLARHADSETRGGEHELGHDPQILHVPCRSNPLGAQRRDVGGWLGLDRTRSGRKSVDRQGSGGKARYAAAFHRYSCPARNPPGICPGCHSRNSYDGWLCSPEDGNRS